MRRRHLLTLATLPLFAAAADAVANTTVLTRVDTPVGPFVIEVNPAVAPITVANYLAYVDQHLLDRAWVYRLVTLANQTPATAHKIEVVQWGLNLPDDAPTLRPAIAHESTQQTGLRHRDGTVSMARGEPGTAAAEFFICIGDQPELDFGGHRHPDGQGFAAFGQVVQGMDVVRALHAKAGVEQWLKDPIPIGPVQRVTGARAPAAAGRFMPDAPATSLFEARPDDAFVSAHPSGTNLARASGSLLTARLTAKPRVKACT